jgi:hypothetical protein
MGATPEKAPGRASLPGIWTNWPIGFFVGLFSAGDYGIGRAVAAVVRGRLAPLRAAAVS